MFTLKNSGRIVVVVAVIALAVTVYVKRPAAEGNSVAVAAAAGDTAEKSEAVAALPRLLDLGADKCVPCKMMAPILEQLKVDYEGVLLVDFLDVWKQPAAAEPYGLKVIPTQIFFSADGAELFRHEGFYSREDILAKWRELGVALPARGA
jgi:thioredoxin 1